MTNIFQRGGPTTNQIYFGVAPFLETPICCAVVAEAFPAVTILAQSEGQASQDRLKIDGQTRRNNSGKNIIILYTYIYTHIFIYK